MMNESTDSNGSEDSQPAEVREHSSHGIGRFSAGFVIAITLAHFLHDTFTALLAPLLPLIIENLGISFLQAGSLVVAIQLPSLLNPFFGYLTDRYALYRIMVVVAPGMTGVLVCLMGLAPTYGVLVVLLLTAGLSVAAIHIAGPVLVAQFSGRSMGRGMAFFMVGGELARTVGPLIAVQLVSMFGLGGIWRVGFVAVASSLFLWWRFASVPVRPMSQRPTGLLDALRGMRTIVVAVGGVLVARAFMSAALTTFLPTFIYGQGHSLWVANISLSIVELAGAAGALTTGTLSDRLGRRGVLMGAVSLSPPLMLLFLFSEGPLRIAALVALGFVALSTTPVLMAVMIENSGANPGTVNGTFMMMSFAIRGLVILLVGALGDWIGLRGAFVACAVLATLGLPFVMMLPRGRRG
jgi:FSR family fosmidomycin resistance protein-like MFS transporter